jgi:hypothetical protein
MDGPSSSLIVSGLNENLHHLEGFFGENGVEKNIVNDSKAVLFGVESFFGTGKWTGFTFI